MDWTDARQVSQEIRLDGSHGAIDYLLGGYFLDSHAESSRTVASLFRQGRADGELDSRRFAVLIDFTTDDHRSATSLTRSASMRYEISDGASVYLRYAQGFKSGGFYVDLVTAAAITPLEFDDEQVDTERVVERHRNVAPGLFRLLGYPPEIADSTVGLYNAPRTFRVEMSLTL